MTTTPHFVTEVPVQKRQSVDDPDYGDLAELEQVPLQVVKRGSEKTRNLFADEEEMELELVQPGEVEAEQETAPTQTEATEVDEPDVAPDLLELAKPDSPDPDETKKEQEDLEAIRSTPEAKKFYKDMETYYGVTPEIVSNVVQMAQDWQYQKSVQEYNQRMVKVGVSEADLPAVTEAVIERFKQLSPKKQALLGDQPEVIYLQLVAEGKIAQPQGQRRKAAAPRIVESTVQTGSPLKKNMTLADFERMSDAEFAQNRAAFEALAKNGLI